MSITEAFWIVLILVGLGFAGGSWITFMFMAQRPWRAIKCKLEAGTYEIESAGPVEIRSVEE